MWKTPVRFTRRCLRPYLRTVPPGSATQPARRSFPPQRPRKECCRLSRHACMNRFPIDAGLVHTELRRLLPPQRGAGVKEGVMRDPARKNGQLRSRNCPCQQLCIARRRRNRVRRPNDNLHGHPNPREARPRQLQIHRRDRKHRPYPRIAMRIRRLPDRRAVGGIATRQLQRLLRQPRKFRRRDAQPVCRLRHAARLRQCLQVKRPRHRPGNHHHRVPTQREARRADPPRIDPRPELLIAEHSIQHAAQIHRPLPAQRESLHRVSIHRVVPRMIHCHRDVPVARETRPQPRHHRRRSARPMREQNQRKFRRSLRHRRILCRAPCRCKRTLRIPHPLRCLLRLRIRRIPDRRRQRVRLCPTPVIRRVTGKERAVSHADLECLRSGRR